MTAPDPSSVSPSEREIEAVWEYLIQHTGEPGVIDGEWRKGSAPEVIGLIAHALGRVRDARGDDEGLCPECQLPKRDDEHQMGCSYARSPQGENNKAVERLTNELQALVDWFNEAPFLRAERLLYDLYLTSSAPADYGEIVSHHPEGPDQIVSPQVEDHEDREKKS